MKFLVSCLKVTKLKENLSNHKASLKIILKFIQKLNFYFINIIK